jgi:hypothetical protein
MEAKGFVYENVKLNRSQAKAIAYDIYDALLLDLKTREACERQEKGEEGAQTAEST